MSQALALRLPVGGVLALDLAGTVGWAYGLLGPSPPASGFWRLPHIGGEGERYARLENELEGFCERNQPAAFVIERSFTLEAFARHSNYRVMAQQITLRGIAYLVAWRFSAAVSEIDPQTVRAEVMGQRRYSKDIVKREVVRYCRERGWKVTDHNQADALVTWEWHRMRIMGVPPVAGPLWRQSA